MKKITMFMADDGKIFKTEKECINYENNLYIVSTKNDIVLFNMDKEIIPVYELTDIIDNIIFNATYMLIKSTKCIYFLHKEISKKKIDTNYIDNFCRTVDKIGLYIFYNGNWQSMENYLYLYGLDLKKSLINKNKD